MGNNVTAVLHTLLYAALFHQPLTFEELWYFLHSKRYIAKKSLQATLANTLPFVVHKNGLYFLKGEQQWITKKQKRVSISIKKIDKIRPLLLLLSWIPTVQLVGITGKLAVLYSTDDDDIDLFIITKRNTLWITRFLVNLFFLVLGKRRMRGSQHEANKICLNMFLDESRLMLQSQDIYTAREIVQLLPICVRNDTYKKFLLRNAWIKYHVANAYKYALERTDYRRYKNKSYISTAIFEILEPFAKIAQIWYMKEHRTREIITDSLLAFHPFDYHSHILTQYEKRKKQFDA